jgi:hypothetical protein
VLKALLIVALPLASLLVGGAFLAALPASATIKNAAAGCPLFSRVMGYDAADATTYWNALYQGGAVESQRSMLEADLAYPLVYGGGFAMALLAAWSMLGRPVNPVWLLAPVLILVAADWTENLVMLAQLDQFERTKALSAGWVQVASLATILKWAFLGVSLVLAAGLALCVARQP